MVLDLKMPGMDGLTVLQQIRHLIPTQPVIILTGPGHQSQSSRSGSWGVTEYVEKQFSLHLLGDALNRLHAPPTHMTAG